MIATLIMGACNNTGKIANSSKEMETKMDSISYALGRDLGNSLKGQEIEINSEMVYQGYKSISDGQEPALTEEQAQQLLISLQNEIRQKQQEAMMQQQQQMQQQPATKFQVGQAVPEISLPTPSGETMSLSELRGKVVLIDFWASWCRPCRAENPNVVRMYNKYKGKGFEIFGVSLDRTKDAWVQAIEQDKLTWHHVSDLQFWGSEAAQAYGVNAIPYTVLLDKQGKVIAENLRGASLESKLAELLGSN